MRLHRVPQGQARRTEQDRATGVVRGTRRFCLMYLKTLALGILARHYSKRMRRPRAIVERAQDAHEDGSEALSEARVALCWPRANVHLERRRDRAQVKASRRTRSRFHRADHAHEEDNEAGTKPTQLHACRASRGSSRAQPAGVDEDSHSLERVRSPRSAPKKPEGGAYGAGNNEI